MDALLKFTKFRIVTSNSFQNKIPFGQQPNGGLIELALMVKLSKEHSD